MKFETGVLRLTRRTRVSKNEQIDFVHRSLILTHPVLTNSMYERLLQGDLNLKALELFFNDYFFASAKGFLKSVLPQAIKAHKDELWKEYIQQIITEECTPRPHYLIFQDFLRNCELSPKQPIIADQFICNMIAGYRSDIPFALGYALGIEVEADYQICLLNDCLNHYFPREMEKTTWFDIHLDEAGEEEHAKITVEVIEHFCKTEDSINYLQQGFLQACNDTNSFMEGLNGLVTLTMNFDRSFADIAAL
jgi:hypothetical protein